MPRVHGSPDHQGTGGDGRRTGPAKASRHPPEGRRPPKQRLDNLSTKVADYRATVQMLFPDSTLEILTHKTREEMIELIRNQISSSVKPSVPASLPDQQSHAAGSPPAPQKTDLSLSPEEQHDLTPLQAIPSDTTGKEEPNGCNGIDAIADNVNALSLDSKDPSYYLGVSSVHAVFKLIVLLNPKCTSCFLETTPQNTDPPQRIADISPQKFPRGQRAWYRSPQGVTAHSTPQTDEMQCIDAYFYYFHIFVPMLDERTFRATYASGLRKDSRWLSLLNIVCALGSIAATSNEDTSHRIYYLRCNCHLSLDVLGSSHLETIQTLGLMGGYYLHYVSQPNLAYSLMGAAQRMALAMGLHDDFFGQTGKGSQSKIANIDLKRRAWWSLICMDTWACGPLGRPGTHSAGIKLPPYRKGDQALEILPFLESIRFCKTARQVQEALTIASLVSRDERANLDEKLYQWYEDLPPILKDYEPCSGPVAIVRMVMRWRYLNQRMLLYRPHLLSYAIRRIPSILLHADERIAIEQCRLIAEETIRDIAATCSMNQMAGWNGVWLIFQAACVPILGLFLDDTAINDPRATVKSCQEQVEIVIEFLERMRKWSPTASRTLYVVSRLLEASKQSQTRSNQNIQNGPISSFAQPLNETSSFPGIQSNPDVPGALNPGFFSNQLTPLGTFMYPNNQLVDILADQRINEPLTQDVWNYLNWTDGNMWWGLPYSDQQGMDLIGGDGSNFETLWSQTETGGLREDPSVKQP